MSRTHITIGGLLRQGQADSLSTAQDGATAVPLGTTTATLACASSFDAPLRSTTGLGVSFQGFELKLPRLTAILLTYSSLEPSYSLITLDDCLLYCVKHNIHAKYSVIVDLTEPSFHWWSVSIRPVHALPVTK